MVRETGNKPQILGLAGRALGGQALVFVPAPAGTASRLVVPKRAAVSAFARAYPFLLVNSCSSSLGPRAFLDVPKKVGHSFWISTVLLPVFLSLHLYGDRGWFTECFLKAGTVLWSSPRLQRTGLCLVWSRPRCI